MLDANALIIFKYNGIFIAYKYLLSKGIKTILLCIIVVNAISKTRGQSTVKQWLNQSRLSAPQNPTTIDN